QDRLVNLCFQGDRVVSIRMKWCQERSGTLEVALGLCNTCFVHECIHVVRRDIENLIKLSQRFGKTSKCNVRFCMLPKQRRVARVEPLSLIEVRLASVPLASPPLYIG